MSDYQVTFNGLTMGAGTPYSITNIDGLGGTSPLRVQDDNRGYIDGSYSGRDFYDARTVTIDFIVTGGGGSNAQTNYKALQNALAPQALGYYVDPTGGTPAASQLQLFQFQLTATTGLKRMYGRSRGLKTPIDPDFTYGYIICQAEFYFPDPRYYDNTAITLTGTTASPANAGWATSCPVITIASPSSSGTIGDGTIFMRFANITTSASLTIDLLQRVIYTGTTPTRNCLLASSTGWLSVPANSPGYLWSSTVGSMSIVYRNAYV